MRKTRYKGYWFLNRKARNQRKMSERFALQVFADNKPWHYMIASGAALETVWRALQMVLAVERKSNDK